MRETGLADRKKAIGLIRLCVNICLEPLDAEVVLRAASLGVPAAGATARPGWEGTNVCVRREGERACVRAASKGSRGAYGSALDMVRESHTLIDGSAAESGGAAEKCHRRWRRHSPDRAGLQSLGTICCWNTTSFFSFLFFFFSPS